jgi:hypothetical protein
MPFLAGSARLSIPSVGRHSDQSRRTDLMQFSVRWSDRHFFLERFNQPVSTVNS